MVKANETLDEMPVALTDEVAAMADYVRSAEGHTAIQHGLADLQAGRIISGKGALAAELKRRAVQRRRA